MTTTELLVLAAKAAGYKIEAEGVESIYVTGNGVMNYCWNPLKEDVDAFRLAADMQFTVQVGSLDGTVVVTSNNDNRVYTSEMWQPGEKPYKAMRTAIVNAAEYVYTLRYGD